MHRQMQNDSFINLRFTGLQAYFGIVYRLLSLVLDYYYYY